MWEDQFKKHLESQTAKCFNHFESSKAKYMTIWDYYNINMPECINECSEVANRYADKPDRDGPQGIYWIGENPEIFFIGRDHYGWYGDANWPIDIDCICFSPLQFSYYTVESMGTYWGIIKDIIEESFKGRKYSWDEKLQKVAFSNACKCLSGNSSYQWNLHANCLKHQYLAREIKAVNAKVNVLFTKSYKLLDKLFEQQGEVLYDGEEFSARKHDHQIIIECAHPGRQSHEWRNRLKDTIKKFI